MSYANGRLPASALAPIPGKGCSRCGETKPLSEFSRDKSHRDGLTSDCRECNRTRQREARARGPLAPVSLAMRLERKHRLTDDGCWEWTGKIRGDGYGSIKVHGAQRVVHRVAYELFVGPVGEELVLDHLCRNRRCLNPDHLRQCSSGENVMASGSQSPSALNAAKTHCPQGHPYDGANTYVTSTGRRHCRACDAARHRTARKVIHA